MLESKISEMGLLRNSEDRVNSLEKENNKLLSDLGELKSVNGVLESKISEMGLSCGILKIGLIHWKRKIINS